MSQTDFFNSVAEKWDAMCRHDAEKINQLLDMLRLEKGASCLDVGTGTGVLIPFLAQRVGETGRITAVDAAARMLEVARAKFSLSNVAFVWGDALDSGFPPAAFDAVVCYCVFPHFARQREAVGILAGYIKAGGKLLICHSQSRQEINTMHKRASQAVAEDFLPDAATIQEYMAEAGLQVADTIDSSEMFAVLGIKKG